MMRWAAHVAHMGEKKNAYRFSIGKPEGDSKLLSGFPWPIIGGELNVEVV
jgi:hypothetical protein